MTRSMTGFSSVSGSLRLISFVIQLKSENSKNLEIFINDTSNNFKLHEGIKKLISSCKNKKIENLKQNNGSIVLFSTVKTE